MYSLQVVRRCFSSFLCFAWWQFIQQDNGLTCLLGQMYSRDLLYRVISWPFCSVTLTEFLRPDVLVQPAPSHVLDRLFCRENTVNVSQQFGEETRIFRAIFWYICSWVARWSANRRSPARCNFH